MNRRVLCMMFLTLFLVPLSAGSLFGGDEGLVARWSLDEGRGSVARDSSGGGNDGVIHNARWAPSRTGSCLEFDGQTSWVDCGDRRSLDVRDRITLEAWILPTGQPRGELGILGKHFESYLLTCYTDGNAWFYIGAGSNSVRAPLTAGEWNHVAATFDGKTLRIYVQGKLMASRASAFDRIPAGGRFTIGMVAGRADANDPAGRNTSFFEGFLDEIRVYHRALSAEEIAVRAKAEPPRLELVEDYRVSAPAAVLKAGTASLGVGAGGELQVDFGEDRYVINSFFAQPGETVAWNALAASPRSPASWQPVVRRLSDSRVEITAEGSLYTLHRHVAVAGDAIEVTDTLRSLRGEPVGMLVRQELIGERWLKQSFSPGGAETPFLYVQGPRSALGLLMEDDLSRLRFEPRTAVRVNACSYRLGNMVLNAGKSLTLKWTVLPLRPQATYWDLVNLIRRRWNNNYTVQGPLDWIDMKDPILADPAKLKASLERKRLNVVLLSPWLDYDPGRHDRVWSRAEYREAALAAVKALKAVQPDLKCLGCIECDWVTIDPAKIPNGDRLPVYGKGSGGLTREQTEIILRSGLPWIDSLKIDANGATSLELYSRGGKPQTALSVYPAPGNYQARFLMEQVKFLIDEVGLDGFYIDEFSQGWNGGFKVYAGWDGVSADVDPKTGRIVRKYTDASLAGVPVRVELVQYALTRGKTVVCNTFATSMAECGLPANRFSETWGQFDPMATPTGEKPPGLTGLFRSNLGSPIGLGILGHPEKHDTAQRLMKALVTYLRHGMVYYHYFLEEIPLEGEGSGEYGPVNHMMPITPVELGEGFIIGKERTVTCVSGTYAWNGPKAPNVLVFDMNGRPTSVPATVVKTPAGWSVGLNLRDWAQIAVIE